MGLKASVEERNQLRKEAAAAKAAAKAAAPGGGGGAEGLAIGDARDLVALQTQLQEMRFEKIKVATELSRTKEMLDGLQLARNRSRSTDTEKALEEAQRQVMQAVETEQRVAPTPSLVPTCLPRDTPAWHMWTRGINCEREGYSESALKPCAALGQRYQHQATTWAATAANASA
jgi:hypothetical protein